MSQLVPTWYVDHSALELSMLRTSQILDVIGVMTDDQFRLTNSSLINARGLLYCVQLNTNFLGMELSYFQKMSPHFASRNALKKPL